LCGVGCRAGRLAARSRPGGGSGLRSRDTCDTGTAGNGLQVLGVDFSAVQLRRAGRLVQAARLVPVWHRFIAEGDAATPSSWRLPPEILRAASRAHCRAAARREAGTGRGKDCPAGPAAGVSPAPQRTVRIEAWTSGAAESCCGPPIWIRAGV